MEMVFSKEDIMFFIVFLEELLDSIGQIGCWEGGERRSIDIERGES